MLQGTTTVFTDWSETRFEEIGHWTAVRNITFPPSRLLDTSESRSQKMTGLSIAGGTVQLMGWRARWR